VSLADALVKVVEGRSLTPGEAEEAMGAILRGEASPPQIAAFLTALRMKGETVEEIAAFAGVMRSFSVKIHPKVPGCLIDTCGTGGSPVKTFNVSTLSALTVAAAGGYVAKHGNRAVSSRCGSADLLEGFGVNIQAEPKTVERCVERVGVGFMFAPKFHQAMKHALLPRREIKIRTVFNILGPLTNPAPVEAQVLGVYSLDLVEKLAAVLEKLGLEKAFVVHGLIGVDEVSLVGPTHVAELNHGTVKSYDVHPRQFGLEEGKTVEELRGGELKQNLRESLEVLGGVRNAKAEMTALNAAYALLAASKVERVEEGLELAWEALSSGKALEKLRLLIKESGGDPGKLEALEHD
jgi:anthranilate phosphoribosyltransferase